jgi:hypothetical protein
VSRDTPPGTDPEIVVEFTQRFTVTPPDQIDDQDYAEQWFWNIYPDIGRDIVNWENAENYSVIEVREAGGDD